MHFHSISHRHVCSLLAELHLKNLDKSICLYIFLKNTFIPKELKMDITIDVQAKVRFLQFKKIGILKMACQAIKENKNIINPNVWIIRNP